MQNNNKNLENIHLTLKRHYSVLGSHWWPQLNLDWKKLVWLKIKINSELIFYEFDS